MIDSFARHTGQAFTAITCRRLKLPIVKIPPSKTDQPKAMTLGGAFILHNGAKSGEFKTAFVDKAMKREAAENIPSAEAIQILYLSYV